MADGAAAAVWASDRPWPDRLLRVLVVAAVAASLTVLALSWSHPLTEAHGFRQAQTAISAWWMLHGGPWVDYWTPVLGPPWSAPFEFPLYQWIIAVGAKLTGLPLDGVGQAVSYLWLLGSLPPAAALMRRFRLPPLSFPIYAALLLASPQYLLWGRAVMIETQAVTLGLLFLWAGERAVATRGAAWTLAATVFGVAAALTKVTTHGPFLAAFGGIVLYASWRAQGWPARLRLLALGAAVALPGVVAVASWNHHADALKAANPLADAIRSNSPRLIWWNFGTLAQRVSPEMLRANLRGIMECFGEVGPLLLALVGWRFAKAQAERRTLWAVLALVGLYLLPWLVFTNLHVVHSYYQTANALFLIAAVAVMLGATAEGQERGLAIVLCLALLVSQIVTFARYGPEWLADPALQRDAALARVVKARTATDSVLLTYGLDWSPVVAYEAERVARMEPNWTTPAEFRTRLPAFEPAPIDGHPVGALIRCPSSEVEKDPVSVARLDALQARWATVRVAGCTVSFPPSPSRLRERPGEGMSPRAEP